MQDTVYTSTRSVVRWRSHATPEVKPGCAEAASGPPHASCRKGRAAKAPDRTIRTGAAKTRAPLARACVGMSRGRTRAEPYYISVTGSVGLHGRAALRARPRGHCARQPCVGAHPLRGTSGLVDHPWHCTAPSTTASTVAVTNAAHGGTAHVRYSSARLSRCTAVAQRDPLSAWGAVQASSRSMQRPTQLQSCTHSRRLSGRRGPPSHCRQRCRVRARRLDSSRACRPQTRLVAGEVHPRPATSPTPDARVVRSRLTQTRRTLAPRGACRWCPVNTTCP